MANTLPVGTIITARYTYGDEILHYKFYAITGYTPKKVRIKEVDSLVTYDDGKDGPHYYDAPKHIRPIIDKNNCAMLIGDSKLVNYTVENGRMSFKPAEYYMFAGVWDGKPKAIYNLH